MAWRPPRLIIWGEALELSYLLLMEVMERALDVRIFSQASRDIAR
jgi:hypothetical protein